MNKRAFLQWFALALSYATGLFFLGYDGLLQAVWHGDVTHMTSVIGAVFLIACAYIGFSTWRFDRWLDLSNRNVLIDFKREYTRKALAAANPDIAVGRSAAYVVTLLGLLGTTIGLMFQVKAMGSLDLSNPQNVVGFIAAIGTSLSTALYATATGIVSCIGITLMTSNLEYFVDRIEEQK